MTASWHRKDSTTNTRNAKIVGGFAEIEQTLKLKCHLLSTPNGGGGGWTSNGGKGGRDEGNNGGNDGSSNGDEGKRRDVGRYGQTRFAPKASTFEISLFQNQRTLIGLHVLDLVRILPAKLNGEHPPWTTSFPLTGKATGATLVATLGFELEMERGRKVAARVGPKTFAVSRTLGEVNGKGEGEGEEKVEGRGGRVVERISENV